MEMLVSAFKIFVSCIFVYRYFKKFLPPATKGVSKGSSDYKKRLRQKITNCFSKHSLVYRICSVTWWGQNQDDIDRKHPMQLTLMNCSCCSSNRGRRRGPRLPMMKTIDFIFENRKTYFYFIHTLASKYYAYWIFIINWLTWLLHNIAS